MKIGFDGKRAAQNYTGLGNYSRYVIRLFQKAFPDMQSQVYTPRQPKHDLLLPETRYRLPSSGIAGLFWRTLGVVSDLKRDGIDVFHGLSNELPFGLRAAGIPSVVTIHDLIFLRFPHFYPVIDRIIYRFKVAYALKNADRIIAISEQTRQDIIRFFATDPDKIEVVYQNCDSAFHTKVSDEQSAKVLQKYQLPENYLLSVGTIEDRKNLLLIVRALSLVPTLKLVVVGRKTPYFDQVSEYINQNKLNDRVLFRHYVEKDDLPAIYQKSLIFVYPSRFEGFGIPVIEALHSRVPVIAAKGSCLEEAGGPGSIYVDPDDPDRLAEAIKTLANNQEKRNEMVKKGREHLQKFADNRIADQMMKIYTTVSRHA